MYFNTNASCKFEMKSELGCLRAAQCQNFLKVLQYEATIFALQVIEVLGITDRRVLLVFSVYNSNVQRSTVAVQMYFVTIK